MGPPVRGVGPSVLLDTVHTDVRTGTTRKPLGQTLILNMLRRMTGFPFDRKCSLVLKLQEILLHIFIDNLLGLVLNNVIAAALTNTL